MRLNDKVKLQLAMRAMQHAQSAMDYLVRNADDWSAAATKDQRDKFEVIAQRLELNQFNLL